MRWFIARNPALASGVLLRTSLFERVGGFREGYYAGVRGKPRAAGGRTTRCGFALAELDRHDLLSCFLLRKGDDVFIEPQPGGIGRVGLREQMKREFGTLLRVAPLLPARVQPQLARRLAGALKAMSFGLTESDLGVLAVRPLLPIVPAKLPPRARRIRKLDDETHARAVRVILHSRFSSFQSAVPGFTVKSSPGVSRSEIFRRCTPPHEAGKEATFRMASRSEFRATRVSISVGCPSAW